MSLFLAVLEVKAELAMMPYEEAYHGKDDSDDGNAVADDGWKAEGCLAD